GGQDAKGVDQVVGQLPREVQLFLSGMHSFSPFRFDLAKQMPVLVSKKSRSHAATSIGTLEKKLRPAGRFDLMRCVAFRGVCCHRIYVAFRDNAGTKRPPFDTINSAR